MFNSLSVTDFSVGLTVMKEVNLFIIFSSFGLETILKYTSLKHINTINRNVPPHAQILIIRNVTRSNVYSYFYALTC